MWTILDILNATVVGAAVILLIVLVNIQISTLSTELIQNNVVQTNTTVSTEILKYDFYKIGYKASSDKIILADSNRIRFISDIDKNNSLDTIYYYFSPLVSISADTTNPNRILYRRLNTQTPQIYALLSEFNLEYYDSAGSTISYGSLSSQIHRNKIKSIRIWMTHSSSEKANEMYQITEWTSIIRPKNLR